MFSEMPNVPHAAGKSHVCRVPARAAVPIVCAITVYHLSLLPAARCSGAIATASNTENSVSTLLRHVALSQYTQIFRGARRAFLIGAGRKHPINQASAASHAFQLVRSSFRSQLSIVDLLIFNRHAAYCLSG